MKIETNFFSKKKKIKIREWKIREKERASDLPIQDC
jgi:hypothetical protein